MDARVSFKAATKDFLEARSLLKLRFLDYFSEAKMEKCNKEDSSVFDAFGIITPCTATYHLEVGALLPLKLGGKKTLKI